MFLLLFFFSINFITINKIVFIIIFVPIIMIIYINVITNIIRNIIKNFKNQNCNIQEVFLIILVACSQ